MTKERKETMVIFFGLIFILFAGTFIFMLIEGWHFIDALYFTTATLTTVGFGDVVPITYAGKFFGVIYMWVGVTIAVYSIAYIGSHVLRKKVEKDASYIGRHDKK